MLEFLAVFGLCKVNRRNAIARGRRPGGYIALTIVLWIVMEIIGVIVGTVLQYSLFGERDSSGLNLFILIIAYSFAGIGALISYLCAKFAPQGDYVDPSTIRNPQYGNQSYNVSANTPAYMAQQQPAQPQEFVHVENPYQAPAAQYCESCGSLLKPGAQFCSACGARNLQS